jgi:hypothetical protein
MTPLLEQAFQRARQLPAETQDAIAQRILDELRDEQAWSTAFARTSDEQWDKLAASVRKEIASGDTESLDDLLQ